ncbi:MAG: chemotaxis protein CheW [Desulfobacterales bacterium]|nr:chemotaxis protein CheW [Desulfobacterales bacterium]
MAATKRVSESLILVPSDGSLHGKPLFYLFSVTQIEEVLTSPKVTPVPFTPDYFLGLAAWHHRPTAMVSLDLLLGVTSNPPDHQKGRSLVVTEVQNEKTPSHWTHLLLHMSSGGRMLSEVPAAQPVSPQDHFSSEKAGMVKGLYVWDDGLIVVPHIEHILYGSVESWAVS